MRYVLAAVAALVVGLVIGGLRPRAEARVLESKIAEMKEKECPSLLGSELVRAIGRPSPAPAPGSTRAPPEPFPPRPPPDPEGEPGDLEEGRTILAARRAQARAALIEEASPSEEALEDFDLAVADMNAEFRALGEDLLARVRELGGPPARSELYRYAADGLQVVLETEKRIQDALGEQAQEADPDAIDPLSHVDPALVDLLLELDRAGFDP